MNSPTRPIRSTRAHAPRALRRLLPLVALAGALAIAGCQAGDSLAGPTWQWTAAQETDPAVQPGTSNSAKYSIEFLTDGTVNVQADCNRLSGTYALGAILDLTITLTPAKMAACGDPALAGTYVEFLGRVASYSTVGGAMKLELADDAGTLQFTTPGS